MNPIIALIPARSGSKRVPGKNIRRLGDHPLIAYTISSALGSGVFSRVIVSTECKETAAIAIHYGAEVPFERPAEYAADLSPDIEWVRYTLKRLADNGDRSRYFCILRPTSPFRKAKTIQRAWARFIENADADSLRAVELCQQHPGKMWVVSGNLMRPLLDDEGAAPPWHSSPYQSLPAVYIQNSSLEIGWNRVPLEQGTIAGEKVISFFTEGDEGFDINKPDDWFLAEIRIGSGQFSLPAVETIPWPGR
jgi:CMP-N-acetylneuraminic acid synthetase